MLYNIFLRTDYCLYLEEDQQVGYEVCVPDEDSMKFKWEIFFCSFFPGKSKANFFQVLSLHPDHLLSVPGPDPGSLHGVPEAAKPLHQVWQNIHCIYAVFSHIQKTKSKYMIASMI